MYSMKKDNVHVPQYVKNMSSVISIYVRLIFKFHVRVLSLVSVFFFSFLCLILLYLLYYTSNTSRNALDLHIRICIRPNKGNIEIFITGSILNFCIRYIYKKKKEQNLIFSIFHLSIIVSLFFFFIYGNVRILGGRLA